MNNIDKVFVTGILEWSGAAAFVWLLISLYNTMVSYFQSVQSARSGIEVELKKRLSLIPQVVETSKKYLQHESGLMRELTELRSRMENASGKELNEIMQKQEDLFSRLFAVAEAYPQLRSSDIFMQLEQILQDTEENLAASRHIYNSNVDIYNSFIGSFPAVILAKIFGYKNEPYLTYHDENLRRDPDIAGLFASNR